MPQSLDEIYNATTKRPSLDDLYKGPAAKPAAKPESGGLWSSAADFFKSIPQGVVRGATSAASALGQAEEGLQTGGAQQTVPGAGESAKLAGVDRLPQPQGAAGRFGGAIGEGFGNPSSYMMPGGVAAKTLGILGASVGGQAGAEATPGSSVGPVIGGMLGGAAPGALSNAARRVVTPIQPRAGNTPAAIERGNAVQTLRGAGVEPSAGDVLGSARLREVERFGSLPGGGGSYERVKRTPEQQLTSAVLHELGETGQYGETLNDTVFRESGRRIGQEFEATARALPIEYSPAMQNDLVAIMLRMQQDGASPEVSRRVGALVRRLLPNQRPQLGDLFEIGPTGTHTMPGERYQAFTKTGENLDRAIHSDNSDLAHYATLVRSAVDDALEATATSSGNTQMLERLRTARRQWYNRLIAFQSVAKRGEMAGVGQINPDTLVSKLTNNQDARLAFAAKRSNLARLAGAASTVMSPYKELGFGGMHEAGGRAAISGLGAGAGSGAGALLGGPAGAVSGAIAGFLAPGGAARLVNSPAVQTWLKGNTDWQNTLRRLGYLQPAPRPRQTLGRLAVGGAIGAQRKKEKSRPQLYE
jgi:hypothetical protein